MRAHASPAGTLLLALGLGLMGCSATASPLSAEPSKPARTEPSEPADRCQPYAGRPTDPSLRGRDRTHEVRCCPSDYGFDPMLARDVCGFAEYLGESEELACVHRFRASDGQLHELRISPILDLELDRAVALHELGTGPTETPADAPAIRWSAVEGRRWAFVPGWSIVRRLGWDEAACAPERMLPVLARMHASASDPTAAVALPRLDEQTDPLEPPLEASLLARTIAAPEPGRRYPLPRSAELLVLELLRAAITHDPEAFAAVLEPDARIGLADRRQLGARAMLGPDGPTPSMQQLLAAAARFPTDAALRCPSLDRRVEPQVARGELMMWCFWISDDGLDLLAFGLRGRVQGAEPDGRVAYLGLFPARPEGPLTVPGEPPAPPVVPMPDLVCSDPHAHTYPDLCPAPEPALEDEDEAEAEAP